MTFIELKWWEWLALGFGLACVVFAEVIDQRRRRRERRAADNDPSF